MTALALVLASTALCLAAVNVALVVRRALRLHRHPVVQTSPYSATLDALADICDWEQWPR